MSVGQSWFVAKTKAQRERWAAENIARQGFEPYTPMTMTEEVVRGQKRQKLQPLFPSYLFVRTDGRWRCITGTFGVASIVMQGQSPAIMPDSAIEQLRARENASGVIVLPKPNASRFAQGDAVRISSGPFVGFNGIWDGIGAADRVRVLLQLLGRQTRILIGEDLLEAV